jgi:hypothetical protein
LAYTIMPRLGAAKPETRQKATDFLKELGNAGFATQVALPSLLVFDPRSAESTISTLRSTLVSTQEEEVNAVISGLHLWLELTSIDSVPSPPQDLIDEWVARIKHRSRPGLDHAINMMAWALRSNSTM